MKIKTLTLCSLLMFCCTALAAISLTNNGQGNYSVVLDSATGAPGELAQRELVSYINKISGAAAQEKGKYTIVIGTTATKGVPRAVRRKLEKSGTQEAFYLKTSGKTIYIVGKDALSSLYGTYTFIEKNLGVRWFYPGELGEDIPVQKSITIGDIDDFQEPDFRRRNFSVCGSSNNFVSTYDWMVRHKMYIAAYYWQLPRMTDAEKAKYRAERGAIMTAGGHNFFRRSVPSSLFAEHPEYFALKKGKRVHEGRVNRCLSNADVVELSAQDLIKKVKADPTIVLEFIGEDDSEAFCECDNCKALGTVNGKYTISNLFHRFFKQLGDKVLAECPKANIAYWAYWNYRPLPDDETIKYPAPNSYLMYATHQRCYVHNFDDKTTCNKVIYNEMMEWGKRAAHLGIYDYRHDANCFYAPFEYILAQDLKTFKKLGVVTWADEVTTGEGAVSGRGKHIEDNFRSSWQNHYMAAKLLWDSDIDPVALMNETYDRYYGKAAPVMKKYHNFRRQLWKAVPGHCILNGPERTAFCTNTPGSEKKLKDYLAAALKLADSDKVRRRIEQDGRFLENYWLAPNRALQARLAAAKDLTPVAVSAPIVIDGNLDETTWLQAQPAGNFVNDKQSEPQEGTKVRLAFDASNLYIAINADNGKAWSPVCAAVTAHDGPVWEDDSIEVQIAPPNESGEFYHLGINTKGVLYDSSVIGQTSDKSYSSKAEVKVVENSGVFQYEILVPLAPMKAKFDSRAWKIHFMRTVTNLQPPTTREWSSMDGVRPFQPQLFRNVTFGKNYIINGNFAELTKQKIGGQEIMFPKRWELYGNTSGVKITKTGKGHEVYTQGVFTTGIAVPKDLEEGSFYNLTVRAKGKGKIGARSWSWEGYSPRTNHRRVEDLPKFDLTSEYRDYTFRIPYLPKEYYIILYVDGSDKTIENISCTVSK